MQAIRATPLARGTPKALKAATVSSNLMWCRRITGRMTPATSASRMISRRAIRCIGVQHPLSKYEKKCQRPLSGPNTGKRDDFPNLTLSGLRFLAAALKCRKKAMRRFAILWCAR
jgi:hypothetical protein